VKRDYEKLITERIEFKNKVDELQNTLKPLIQRTKEKESEVEQLAEKMEATSDEVRTIQDKLEKFDSLLIRSEERFVRDDQMLNDCTSQVDALRSEIEVRIFLRVFFACFLLLISRILNFGFFQSRVIQKSCLKVVCVLEMHSRKFLGILTLWIVKLLN
jgi:hypothetical protein